MKIPTLPIKLQDLVNQLEEIYFVGGCVRDCLMGKTPKDFDFEVHGVSADKLEEILAQHGKVDFVGKSFGVYILRPNPDNPQESYEIALPRTEIKTGEGHRGFDVVPNPNLGVEKACQRRDFSVNSIMIHAKTYEVVDPANGIEDIKSKTLRPTNLTSFTEDPLRVLRAMQICSRLELNPTQKAIDLASLTKTQHQELSKERVWVEWEKWATKSEKPSLGLKWLEQTSWIENYPELQAMLNVPQDPTWHPEGDAWTHTLATVDAMTERLEWKEAEPKQKIILLLGILCHDLGKPATTQFKGKINPEYTKLTNKDKTGIPEFIDEKWRSPGHEEAGLEPTQSFLERINTPKEYLEPILAIVKYHMAYLPIDLNSQEQTTREQRHCARDLAYRCSKFKLSTKLLVTAMKADHNGRPPLEKILPEKARKLEQALEITNCLDKPEPAMVTGKDLIQEKVPQGEAIGKIKEHLYQLQIQEKFQTREQGIKYYLQNRSSVLRRCNALPERLITGKQIQEAGVPWGPEIGILNEKALALQLDGKHQTIEEANKWLKTQVQNLKKKQKAPQIN